MRQKRSEIQAPSDDQFRAEWAAHLIQKGGGPLAVASELGYSDSLIKQWRRVAKGNAKPNLEQMVELGDFARDQGFLFALARRGPDEASGRPAEKELAARRRSSFVAGRLLGGAFDDREVDEIEAAVELVQEQDATAEEIRAALAHVRAMKGIGQAAKAAFSLNEDPGPIARNRARGRRV